MFSTQQYTQQEIDKHQKQGDLWVKMGTKVLDVSKFKHPGGNDKLIVRAGKDVYEDFLQTKHSKKAQQIASTLIIGTASKQNQTPISSFLSPNMAFGPAFGEDVGDDDKQNSKNQNKIEEEKVAENIAAAERQQMEKFAAKQQQLEKERLMQKQKSAQQQHVAREIDFQELKQHTTHKDLWLLINGKVYDASRFKHPGGKQILVQNAGIDATQAFQDQNHTQAALDQLKGLYIGEFRGAVLKQNKGSGGELSSKNKIVLIGFILVVASIFLQYFLFAPAYDA